MNNYKILPPPNVSPADPLLYRALQLDNNLKVLLISDPTASLDDPNQIDDDEDLESGSEGAEESSEEGSDNSDSEGEPGPGLTSDVGLRNSAAALSVASGSFHEPKDAPGLAHFLEHMVFMGSKKYPDENKFDKFVSARNGWDNAYTDAEQTVYYFEVKPSAFDEALDIWSRFYIDPIMSKDSVNREIQAVDSEFSIAQTNDANRISGILCHLAAKASENHPSGKFGWGNILSLKGTKDTSSEAEIPKLYSNLLDLHKKYYSAKIMSLAVQSPHSLDELQEFVLSKFSEIPNRENFVDPFSTIEQFSSNVDIWKSCYGSNLIEVLPVGDKSKLYINFQLPPLMNEFKSDPAGYISWLLGHEGKGSVLDFLQEKELANSLEAGLGGYGDSFNHLYSLFEITISLTEKGAEKENLKTVLSAIFTYLEMLRKDGPKKEIWEMINKLENISWKTKEVSDPSDNVEGIAANMSKYPDSEHWLDADYVHPEYEPEKIQNLLDLMKYDRSVKMVVNPKFRQEISEKETEKEETIFPESDAWFGVRWRTSKDTYEFTDSQKLPDKTFFYPGKNPFLTDDLDLKVLEKEKTEFPIQINPKNDPKGILIFKPDFTFKLPKGDFRMIFKMEKFNQNMNVKQKALYSILPTFLVNMGSAELYDANAADFSYTISGRTEGLTFSAKGISEPLNKLVNTLMKYLVEFDNYDENMFNIAVEKSIKSIKTVLLDSGGLAQNVRLGYLMGNPQISILDVLKCLQSGDLTLNDLKIFVKELLKNSRAECAIHGNFTKKEALSIYKNDILGNRGLKNLIKGQPEHHEILVRKLPKKRQSIKLKSFNTRSADNHYVLKMYQYKLGDLYDDTILEVVAGIVSEPTFNTLRF